MGTKTLKKITPILIKEINKLPKAVLIASFLIPFGLGIISTYVVARSILKKKN